MINVNVTLLIQMCNFLVLLFLMNLVLYRPIRRIVAKRKQFVEEQQLGIERMDAEVKASIEDFNQKIQDARRLGREKIQELKVEAYAQEKELMRTAVEQAGKQLQDVRARIQSDIQGARDQLSDQVRAFSVDLAQKILGRSL
jgi:F-type H+-transporting ATPase subunit b